MFTSIPPGLKRLARPIALPAWLKLQEFTAWQRIMAGATEWRAPRELHAFGVGLPKTGTVSLANLLRANYRASHEPETWILTHVLQSATLGAKRQIAVEDRIAILQARDHLLNLNLESNFVLGLVIDSLYAAFPNAKYILTIRDCYSWINSEINQQYVTGPRQPWSFLADYRYGPQRHYRPEDACLQEHNLYPVASYFSYWAAHIRAVRDTVPTDQLLIVRTEDLSYRTHDIADFLGIPHESLNLERSHSHQRHEKPLNIRQLVGSAFLERQASFFCGDLMEEYYDSLVPHV